MFVLSKEHNGVPENHSHLVSVLHSINEPKIAAADHPAEPTQAFVCMSEGGADELRAHIILFLTESQARVTYRWEEGKFPTSVQPEVEEEALDFVENMGFMMDNLNLHKLSEAEREELLSKLPIFETATEAPSSRHPAASEEDEILETLKPIGEGDEPAPTSVASPLSEKFRKAKEASERANFDENRSMAALEAEFARDDEFEKDLESAVSSLASKPGAQEPPLAKVSRFRAIVRLMASF